MISETLCTGASRSRYPSLLLITQSSHPFIRSNISFTTDLVSILAALGTLNTAIINPAYSQLSTTFNITLVQASYQTTVVVALNGIGLLFWIPLANIYGRRPIFLITTLLGFVRALGSAYAQTYGQLIGARVVNGLFPAVMALGPSTVVDLFWEHQRGRAMGLFTVVLTTGAHIAPIVGGLAGQFLGWRWIFKLATIMDGVVFVVILFGLPETLYPRNQRYAPVQQGPVERKTTKKDKKVFRGLYWSQLLRPYAGPFPGLTSTLRLKDFIWPVLRMAKHPSVLFPAAY